MPEIYKVLHCELGAGPVVGDCFDARDAAANPHYRQSGGELLHLPRGGSSRAQHDAVDAMTASGARSSRFSLGLLHEPGRVQNDATPQLVVIDSRADVLV